MLLLKKIKNKKIKLIIFIITIVYIACLLPTILILIGQNWQDTSREGNIVLTTSSFESEKFSNQPKLLSKEIKNYFQKNNLNAITITSQKGQKLPIIISNGNVSNFSNEKINENSMFQIGSIQKIFTAVIIQKLILSGKIYLSEPLSNFYPNVLNGSKITIANLLTHTSGIQDGNYQSFNAVKNEKSQVDYVLNNMTQSKKLGYCYASANYSLLAGIIRIVTNNSYQDNVKEYIIKPLNLKNTYFYQNLPENNDLVYPKYVKNHLEKDFFNYDINKQMSYLIGAGQMYSSAKDYYLFLSGLINGKLIPKNKLQNFFPKNNHSYYNGGYNYYGYFEAGGSQNGYNLSFMLDRNTKAITILFSSNFMLIPNKRLADNIFLVANKQTPILRWFPN